MIRQAHLGTTLCTLTEVQFLRLAKALIPQSVLCGNDPLSVWTMVVWLSDRAELMQAEGEGYRLKCSKVDGRCC